MKVSKIPIASSPPIAFKNPAVESYALYPISIKVVIAFTRNTPVDATKSATPRTPLRIPWNKGRFPNNLVAKNPNATLPIKFLNQPRTLTPLPGLGILLIKFLFFSTFGFASSLSSNLSRFCPSLIFFFSTKFAFLMASVP